MQIDNYDKIGTCCKCNRKSLKVKWLSSGPRYGFYCDFCYNTAKAEDSTMSNKIFCAICDKDIRSLYYNTDEGKICHDCFCSNMYCPGCNKKAKVLYSVPGMKSHLCKECSDRRLLINPSTKTSNLMLRFFITTRNQLIDADNKKMEYYKTIAELKRCGWSIKQKIEFLPGSPELEKNLYKTLYTLVYCGDKKCKRFPDISWPVNATECSDTFCR